MLISIPPRMLPSEAEPGAGRAALARPVHLIITMIKWIRTSRLSIKHSLFWQGAAAPKARVMLSAGG